MNARCTVIVPVFNEARSLASLAERLGGVLDAAKLDWEVLFVDDGSKDESFEEIQKLHGSDARFRALRFARNFGSHAAISAGLEHAFGDIAIVTTADLEEPPETIPELLARWREGNHVVWGIRKMRRQGLLAKLASVTFHKVFAWLARQAEGQGEIGGGLFLADKKVLDTVRRFPERNRNIVGLILWAGFKQTRIVYEPASRKFGRSKWSLAKKVRLALDTFVAFSDRPLRLMLGAGVVAASLGFAALVAALAVTGWAGAFSLATIIGCVAGAVLLLAGLQGATTGLLGEYVARGLDESRGRPLYVVMDSLGVEERAAVSRDAPA